MRPSRSRPKEEPDRGTAGVAKQFQQPAFQVPRYFRIAPSDTGNAGAYKWEFKPRFRRHAFGWKSQPAIQRIKQAQSEIKKVARKDPVLAAEGAVALIERLSPALEKVDGSSGALGTAVNHALVDLVPVIANAPADSSVRAAWLERLWAAHEADQMPYIEAMGDHWGDLCVSIEVASSWADRLTGITGMALSPDPNRRGHFHGTSACPMLERRRNPF